MNVGVRYLAQLRGLAGCAGERVELTESCTLAGLVAVLLERHPGLKNALSDGTGHIRPGILVFVGDEQAGPERALKEGDEVTFLTPIAGGGRSGFPA
jgi:molybdopterin converting factor small subunit